MLYLNGTDMTSISKKFGISKRIIVFQDSQSASISSVSGLDKINFIVIPAANGIFEAETKLKVATPKSNRKHTYRVFDKNRKKVFALFCIKL